MVLVLQSASVVLHATSSTVPLTYSSRICPSGATSACNLPASIDRLRVIYDAEVDDVFINKYRMPVRRRKDSEAAVEKIAMLGKIVHSLQLVDGINLHQKGVQAQPNTQQEAKYSPSPSRIDKGAGASHQNPAITKRSVRSVAINAEFEKDLTRILTHSRNPKHAGAAR